MYAMTLEQLIEDARTRNGTHEQSLAAAQERMRQTNLRLGKLWKASEVTEELLNKVIGL
jgi:predicted transposase YdaD